ncbi:MAG: Unknown protein [uncultured Sulfurovum sp.]|uniref:Uncharacterized protein n=1 Tax=uncultured Sulfurovum sp. TaxID=269237 RepID=A0A6S6SUH1_9BACT|nr:MAG: Unknown protein [uncultured Sulfurovum sp.]
MPEIKRVKENYLVIQLEQLLTIKKELLHTKRICSYFSTNSDPYADIYQYNLQRVNIFLNKIEDIKTSALKIQNKEKVYQFLIEVARLQKLITAVLDGLKLLKDSIRQHGEEAFNQYIPKADLGRRYSSKAISTFIRSYMTEVLDCCDNDKNAKALIVWTFRNEFQSKEKINPRAIETPHYYYDLPYFIPNIFHELNHIASSIPNPSDDFLPYKKLNSNIETTFKMIEKEHQFSINNGLAEEITSDIFAYDLLGPSYLYSSFYSIMYSGMDNLFLETEDSTHYPLINLDINENSKQEEQDTFAHVIEIQLRMMILIQYALGDNSLNDVTQQNIRDLQCVMQNTFNTEDTSSSLLHSYKSRIETGDAIDNQNFNHFVNLIDRLNSSVESICENFTDHIIINFNSEINYKSIFMNIWQEKLQNSTMVFHRNSLREGILKQIFPIDTYSGFTYDPYELTFFKPRETVNIERKIDTYFKEHTGVKYKHGKDYSQYKSFGIYNNIAIRKKSKEIKRELVEDFLINSAQEDLQLYTYKVAMVKLSEGTNEVIAPKGLSAMFQIQLKNQGPNNIRKAYDCILDILKEQRGLCSYEIYKILGPNDYLINVSRSSLSTIFKLKNIFSKDNSLLFRRTFTTIYTNNTHFSNVDVDFVEVTKVRLRGDYDVSELSKIVIGDKPLSDYYKTLAYTTGAMDIEIEWKINIDITPIVEKINYIISDIQTDYKLIINS